MAEKKVKRLRAPTHPGAVLREIAFPAMDVKVAQAARDMEINRQGLHMILTEKRPITPQMALRIGKYCGNGPDVWLRMQNAYDLWYAKRELKAVVNRIPTPKTPKVAVAA